MTSRPPDPLPYQGPPAGLWYGQDPAWRLPLQARARRKYGPALRVHLGANRLVYALDALPVVGEDPVHVAVTFDADQRPHHYGLHPRDYPHVHANLGARSKHRLPGDALCLYNPYDPPERRWRSENGLDVLLLLAADHLFAETYWRTHGIWVLEEAPHGVSEGAKK